MAEDSKTLETLIQRLEAAFHEHHPGHDTVKIRRAIEIAAQSHEGQVRQSGEPYIVHPLEVAIIVAELGMDEQSLISAILHDAFEDTTLSSEQVEEEFGIEVVQMIEGVTKLSLQIEPEANASQKAKAESQRAIESLRKLLMAMAKDFRVMVIKLADRLHNMRTLESLPPHKQTRISNETLSVYAPLAARLGIWQIKWQLEDLAFKILHPSEFSRIKEMVAKSRSERENEMETAMELISERLKEHGLGSAMVKGRPKHLYSIFNKHVQQKVPFEEIYDLIAIRVICEEEFQCYLALGLVYEVFKPIPGLYSDYIQTPKPNGYQSLHTKVVGPSGEPMEVQIRTRKMHEVAEFGIAAHWTYKEGHTPSTTVEGLSGLRKQLFDFTADNSTSSDFLRNVSTDLFSEQVFVFTPKGDVLDLPAGSTSVDFAFRVHSRIGETLVGTKVNSIMVPLATPLKNGDVVELITRRDAQPSLDWLEFTKSAHARTKIRTYFRLKNREIAIARGREAVEKEMRAQGLEPRTYMGEEPLKTLATKLRDCKSASDVFARVGEGLSSVQSIVSKLRKIVAPEEPTISARRPKEVERDTTVVSGGIDNVMLKRARCCQPVPGEEVMGFVTRGRGIMLHRRLCPNIQRLVIDDPDRIHRVKWTPDGTAYSVDLKIITMNRQGLLMDITTIFGEARTNVSGAKIKTLPNQTAEIEITIDVVDNVQLRELMSKIGNYTDVISILRVFGRGARK